MMRVHIAVALSALCCAAIGCTSEKPTAPKSVDECSQAAAVAASPGEHESGIDIIGPPLSTPTDAIVTVIRVRVGQGGHVASATVVRPSGCPAYDRAVLAKVERQQFRHTSFSVVEEFRWDPHGEQ